MASGRLACKAWDTAAGTLLIREAGGLVATLDGGEYKQNGNIVAGTPRVFNELLETHRAVPRPPELRESCGADRRWQSAQCRVPAVVGDGEAAGHAGEGIVPFHAAGEQFLQQPRTATISEVPPVRITTSISSAVMQARASTTCTHSRVRASTGTRISSSCARLNGTLRFSSGMSMTVLRALRTAPPWRWRMAWKQLWL